MAKSVIALGLFMPAVALAASCFENTRTTYYDDLYADTWGLKSTICGGSGDARTLEGSAIFTAQKNQVYAGMAGPYGSNPADNCEAAFDDIINSCVYAGHAGGGSYTLNNYVYSLLVSPTTDDC